MTKGKILYRIYLRWPDQRVTDKTNTTSAGVAETAFRELLSRTDLIDAAADVAAVLSLDGKQLEYCAFNLPEGTQGGLKSPDAAIKLHHDVLTPRP